MKLPLCHTPKTHTHTMHLAASLYSTTPTMELCWNIQVIHSSTLLLHVLALPPAPRAQIPPGAGRNIREPPQPILCPLTAATPGVPSGPTPSIPAARGISVMKREPENTRAFVLSRLLMYSQRGIIWNNMEEYKTWF